MWTEEMMVYILKEKKKKKKKDKTQWILLLLLLLILVFMNDYYYNNNISHDSMDSIMCVALHSLHLAVGLSPPMQFHQKNKIKKIK